MTWDREVLDVLADGYDVHYGARSIKHEVRLPPCRPVTLVVKQTTKFRRNFDAYFKQPFRLVSLCLAHLDQKLG